MKYLIVVLLNLGFLLSSFSQTTAVRTESHFYKKVDGRIVIPLTINGKVGDFLLDLNGRTSILPEFATQLEIKDSVDVTPFDFLESRPLEANKKVTLNTISFGNNVFSNGLTALLLQGKSAAYLRGMGLVGVINGALFMNSVLTIDKKGGRILTSVPYRPSFMNLSERVDCQVSDRGAVEFNVALNDKGTSVVFDTWQTATIVLKSNANMQKSKVTELKIADHKYGADIHLTEAYSVPKASLVNVALKSPVIGVNPALVKPVAGLGLLDYGLVSIDFSKSKLYFQSYEGTVVDEGMKPELATIVPGKLNAITKDDFIAYIYDYKAGTDFKLKGNKPVVIDFWASWCGPCMKLLPTMEKLAEKYKDQVIFYKVNADREKELGARFNVTALPTMLLVKPGQAPIVEIGDQPGKIIEIIEKQLLGM